MSDYITKLTQISERRQKLLSEENKLIEKRKKEIGSLAEKFRLLLVSDELLAGLFSEARRAIEETDTRKTEQWEHAGKLLIQEKPSKSKKSATAKQS